MDLITFDFIFLIPFLVHLVIFFLLRKKQRMMSEAFMLSLFGYWIFFTIVLWPSLPAYMAIMFLIMGVPMLALVAHFVYLIIFRIILLLTRSDKKP
ncbi:hypothetical protein MKQ68_02440 [Chitinophaga horti]|uniref:Uncharacterized protein n=1 Tax=Chitinophaga horti TaxID=2920382 RepID=A0ABY6J5T9_9BACT|nr:hypothetical protein [Chitinophaga horti]UYQ93952.1 hypothetical protein MKQ68_02440 [Chitinophaga horti]